MKFRILTSDGMIEIDGKPIIIPGFEGINFFLHKDLGCKSFWSVSEARSGRKISLRPLQTQKEVMAETIDRLSNISKERVIEIILQQEEVNKMLPAEIKVGDHLVSAKTGKRYRITKVNGNKLTLYNITEKVDVEIEISKINPELYYVEVSEQSPVLLKAVKAKKMPKVKLTAEQKQAALAYLEQADIAEWLRQELIKEVKR